MSRRAQSPVRGISDKYFELLLVTLILAGTLVIHHLVSAKHVMLHFYYLPVIIAAFYLGRQMAGTIALLAFLTVSILALFDTSGYMSSVNAPVQLGLTLCVWGGFLGLNAILIGTLCDQRAAHIRELREAHMGTIEVLSKYLQAADQYTKSHSMRVAELSEEIGAEMKLGQDELEDIRVGALLHDIGKVEVSTSLIQKAAALSDAEREEMAAHTFHGAELVRSLGSILKGAIPIILHHHDHYSKGGQKIPLGARVVAVADTYDAIVTDRPYRTGRTPQEAMAVIQQNAGTQFDPRVVAAFSRVMVNRANEPDLPEQLRDEPRAAHHLNVEIPAPAEEEEDVLLG